MNIAVGIASALLLGWGGFLFTGGIALVVRRRFGKGSLYVLALPLLAIVAVLLAVLSATWFAPEPGPDGDPSMRARALGEAISAAMNCGAVGLLLGALLAVVWRMRRS